MGFGRRRENLSHEDCIKHHRDTHSKLGVEQAAHLGKYVMYYFSEAWSGGGSALGDLPWDMAEVAWLEEERWNNFQKWLAEDPAGEAIKADEEQFLDRDRCYLVVCNEDTVVDTQSDANDESLVRVLKLAADDDTSIAVRQHRDLLTPLIKEAFGPSLKSYVAHYVTEAMNLARGAVSVAPMDIVERYKIDKSVMDARDGVQNLFALAHIIECESSILDRDRTVLFRGDEAVYI
jgi:hypothetical protein